MNVKDTPLYKQAIADGAKIKRVAGAIIYRIRDNNVQVLLIKRAADDHWPNHWEFPRGGVEPGEDFIKGLKREAKEETGLDVQPLFYLDSFCYAKKEKGRIVQLSIQDNWVCRIVNDDGLVKLSHEHDDFQWISFPAQALLATNGELQKSLEGFFSIPNIEVALKKFLQLAPKKLGFKKDIVVGVPQTDNNINQPIEEAFLALNYKNL